MRPDEVIGAGTANPSGAPEFTSGFSGAVLLNL